jgi:hypothetical protein
MKDVPNENGDWQLQKKTCEANTVAFLPTARIFRTQED